MEAANKLSDAPEPLVSAEESILFGRGSSLDSLGLVSLIVDVERLFEEEHGVVLTLADDKAMSQKASPFRTVETLADYIGTLLNGRGNHG
jgi:acyl carrier protein